jgi:undecaprenyl-diphosphatase
MISNFIQLEGDFLLFIQEYLRSPFLTPIFKFITSLGDKGAIWIISSVVLLFFKKTRKIGILALVALLFSLIIDNIILKNVVARIRPFEAVEGLNILVHKPSDYSFPSGHTGSSFAAAVIFYKTLPKKYGIPSMVLAVLISISRLYVGVHYPSDVICGAVIGIAIALGVYYVYLYQNANQKDNLLGNVE